MRRARSIAITGALALFTSLSTACVLDGGGSFEDGEQGSGAEPPRAAPHAYRGSYEVPVAAELASAAVYSVPEVEWEIEAGTAKLEYLLPLGLVGWPIRVEFMGPYDALASSVKLSGLAGTA